MAKLVVEVVGIRGQCPIYKKGDSFNIHEGYQLQCPPERSVCMHALASLMPVYLALYNGVEPQQMGLQGPIPGSACVQCLDPCDITLGGTVTFSIKRED